MKYTIKIDWDYISDYQAFSEEFRKEFDITIPDTCWLYKTNEEKLKYLKENTNYEIVDNEYVIAYKSTKIDGSSVFKRGITYKVGKTYSSNCDCNINHDNSFGLAAWTKEKALEYYDKGKLFKVKIPLASFGVVL